MRLAAPGCLAETCTDSPSNIWIENSSRNSNKSLLGRNYFSMRFKGAESRINAMPEDIDYQHPRGLKRRYFQELLRCDWIRQGHNALIIGPTGVGKTFLSCAMVM